jgi:hypothetical protein
MKSWQKKKMYSISRKFLFSCQELAYLAISLTNDLQMLQKRRATIQQTKKVIVVIIKRAPYFVAMSNIK